MGMSVAAMAQKLIPTTDEKGRAGYADESGKIVIPCKYEAAYPFHNGRARVQKGGKIGLIDEGGTLLLPCKYDQIRRMGPGMPYRVVCGGKYGLVDATTYKDIIPCKYTYISKFNRHGMAWIAAGGKLNDGKLEGAKYGTASTEGVCIPAKYVVLAEFNGQSNLQMIGSHSYVPKRLSGNIADTLSTRAEYMAFHKSALFDFGYGLLDNKGTILIPANKVMYLTRPRSGMVRTWTMKKRKSYICSYYNLETKTFTEVGDFSIYDESALSQPTHGDFMGDIAPVRTSSNAWKIINRQGESVGDNFENLKFGRGRERGEGYMAGRTSEGTFKVYDAQGEEILKGKKYEDITFPNYKIDDQEVFLVMKDNKWGAVDRANKEYLPMEYDRVLSLRHGLFPAKKHGMWGMITTENKEYVPCQYADVILNDESNPKYMWVRKTAKDSLEIYDVKARKIISAGQFHQVRNFEGDYAWAISVKQPICNDKSHQALANDANLNARLATITQKRAQAYKMIEWEMKRNLGNIYTTTGKPCFSFLVPSWLSEEALELARKYNGNIPMGRQRQFLLKHSSAIEHVSMSDGRISEGLWDY